MFGKIRRIKRKVVGKTVYMEVYGDNKIAYRVTAGRMDIYGETVITYGIEAEDPVSGEKEMIPDFSRNVEDAVDFAEMLITKKIHPRQIYSKALGYLCISI